MADSQDTTVADSTDTSTTEDTQGTEVSDVDKALESFDDDTISFEDGEDDDTAEEGKESDDEEANDSTDDTADDTEEDDETEEQSDESKDEEKVEEKPLTKAQQKKLNDEMAQKRIAEREAKEAAKAEAQQKYLDEAEDNRDLAVRQLQIDAYNNKIENNSNRLQNGIEKAVASIDLFTKGSPEVKEELAKSLDDFERMYVVKDENGDPLEVKGDVLQFLQDKADSIRRLTGIGARQQEKDKSGQKSRTLQTPSKTPKTPKVDPDLAGFDEEAARYR